MESKKNSTDFVNMKYVGSTPTLVRLVRNEPKVEVKKGGTVSMHRDLVRGFMTSYKGVWILAKEEDEKLLPEPAAVMNGMIDPDRIAKDAEPKVEPEKTGDAKTE